MSKKVAESVLRNCENGCFLGDTFALMLSGFKRIDQIIKGEYVLSKDVKT